MREVEAWCYIDAIEEIKRLEKESLDVREYLRNLRLLKTIDSQALKTLEKVASEENFQEILQITGKTAWEKDSVADYCSTTKKNSRGVREKIILTNPIIQEFDYVSRNGSSSMKKKANLWDYQNDEVLLELKYSVAKIITLDGKFLFSVSGRPSFCEKIANLAGIDKQAYQNYNFCEDDEGLDQEIAKVEARVPEWFRKTYQNNSKILIAFLRASNYNTTPIYPSEIEKNCDLPHDIFYNNFNNMKSMPSTIGRVFRMKLDGKVELWEPVASFILQQYKQIFKKQ